MRLPPGFAVPAAQVTPQPEPQRLHGVAHLLAHVQAVGELATEDGHHSLVVVDLDLVLA